jgi:hypothetical protein
MPADYAAAPENASENPHKQRTLPQHSFSGTLSENQTTLNMYAQPGYGYADLIE